TVDTLPDLDEDDKMSTSVSKHFEGVPQLAKDGSNYRIWRTRTKNASKACDGIKFLTTDSVRQIPAGNTTITTDTADALKIHNQMLNIITQKLPDVLYIKYMGKDTVYGVMEGLKEEFRQSIATTEAWIEEKFFSLKCTDKKKLRTHLDQLIDLKNKLAKMKIEISNCSFINAVTTSIPRSFQPTLTAVTAAIAATNKGSLSKDSMSSAVNKRGRGRGHGRGRGRGQSRGRGRGAYRGQGRGGNNNGGDSHNNQNSNEAREDPVCYKCGGTGHITRNCANTKTTHQGNAHLSSSTKESKPKEKGKAKQTTSNIVEEAWSANFDIPTLDPTLFPPIDNALATVAELKDDNDVDEVDAHVGNGTDNGYPHG
ncbi:hypothetical protein BDN72DRAFT_866411, partial [Pluteus cervinus]